MSLRIDNYTPNQHAVLTSPDEIFLAIREGLSPFHTVRVEVEVDYEVEFYRYVIWASAWFGHKRIAHYVDVFVPDYRDNPESEQLRVAKEMFFAFRFNITEDIPDNIELGEN